MCVCEISSSHGLVFLVEQRPNVQHGLSDVPAKAMRVLWTDRQTAWFITV